MKCDSFPARANKRITIQPPTLSSDNYGGASVSWASNNIQAWAIIEPASGREVFAQGQDQSRVDTKMTIRYNSTLKNTATAAKYRVSFDSRIFTVQNIRNMDEDMTREGKAFQVLFCTENGPEHE